MPRLMKKLIAIVEDEPAIRDNYAAAFQRHGYAVRTLRHAQGSDRSVPRCACRISP